MTGRWLRERLLRRSLSLRLSFQVTSLALLVLTGGGDAQAELRIEGATYCVGAPAPSGGLAACESPEIVREHRRCWHDHGAAMVGPGTAYTDGRRCYRCFDECDSTCDLVFLEANPDWQAVPELICGLRIPWAETSEGVVQHFVRGKEREHSSQSPVPQPTPQRSEPTIEARSESSSELTREASTEPRARGDRLRVDMSTPEVCYVGRPCVVSFKIVAPDSGRVAEEARLFIESAEVTTLVGAEEVVHAGGLEQGVVRIEYRPERAGNAFFRMLLRSQEELIEESAGVVVREAVRLSAPSELSLGVVTAGVSWEETCVPLDLEVSSMGLFLTPLEVSLEDVEDCECTGDLSLAMTTLDPSRGEGGLWIHQITERPTILPELYRFEARGGLVGNEGVSGIQGRLGMAVCLSGLPRCPKGTGVEGRRLRLRSGLPEFAEEEAMVTIRYEVAERSTWSCWSGLAYGSAAGLAALFVLFGFTRPHSFAPSDRIAVAGSLRALSRANSVPLENFPGGSPGWYRSAQVAIGAGGARLSSARRALLVIRARPAGPELIACQPLQIRNRRTRRMEPAERSGEPRLLRSGEVYQVGDLYVRVG